MASRKEQREQARKEREQREAEERKKQRRKRRLWQVGAGLAVVAAVVIVAILVSSSGGGGGDKPAKGEVDDTTEMFQGIAQEGVTLGNPEAKVTLYEFADLQCPFCKEFTLGPFPQIVERYVRSGRVKIVFRNLTFLGGDSVTGARAAAAAGAQNKLWDFVDLFYKRQGVENSGYVTDKFLDEIGKAAGVDTAKMKADMTAPFVEQQLGQAQEQATQFNITSTPSFLIQIGDGKPKRMQYQDFKFESFKAPIDAALKEARSSAK